jgi:RNA polymerase sigma factor (sigma-70 family)
VKLSDEISYSIDELNLSEREKEILQLRGENLPYADIGKQFGVSAARARQIYLKAAWKIRKNMFEKGLLKESDVGGYL